MVRNGKLMSEALWRFGFICALVILLFTGCSTTKQEVANVAVPGGNGELFSFSEVVSDGEKFQMLESESGLAIVPRRADLAIQFGTNAFMHVFFNEETLKPERVMIEPMQMANKPAQSVYDLNADGMADTREIEGRKQAQIFYKGAWYDYEEKKDRYIIHYQGKPLELTFGSEGWEKVVEKKKPASRKRKSR